MPTKDTLERMFAALIASNKAILRSHSERELCQRVCEAAVRAGKLLGTSIVLLDDASRCFRLTAAAGSFACVATRSRIPADSIPLDGPDFDIADLRAGNAFISNDIRNEPRLQHWNEITNQAGMKAGALIPLQCEGKLVGVMSFGFCDNAGVLDRGVVRLLRVIAENVSFGMEMFKRDSHRERLAKMFAALSATNEAILRAKTRSELFDRVCEAAALGGDFVSVAIALARPGQEFMDVVAAAGSRPNVAMRIKHSVDASRRKGMSLSGRAFQSRQPCISNDYLADSSTALLHNIVGKSGSRSSAAFPLMRGDRSIGVLSFLSRDLGTFTPDLSDLLQRLADNVSFGMENFDRESEKIEADNHISYLAQHDSLTHLLNRATFDKMLNALIETARAGKQGFALLFMDLDRFKMINDTLGHTAGDALLIEISARLRQNLRASDIVARLGGDEFIIVLRDLTDPQQADAVAQNLLFAIAQPMVLQDQECSVTASIGIALYPDNGDDEHTLVHNADIAMYRAKDGGKNDVRFFSDDMEGRSIERLRLENNLRKALERNEFLLHYQPKIDVGTGRVTGVEALLRWNAPGLGVLPPDQFIPLAEETGLIVPIGNWALRAACEQHMRWRCLGLPLIRMAVNLSPRQFQDEYLLRNIDRTLAETGMRPELLELEVTESMVMKSPERSIGLLASLKERGIRLAMDDFGTGYSSMSLIRRVPIDVLKIDRSFVCGLPDNNVDMTIARAIIGFGKALGLTVVAEGVETDRQWTFLRENACDEIQGYLFSRPVPADDIPTLLRTTMTSTQSAVA